MRMIECFAFSGRVFVITDPVKTLLWSFGSVILMTAIGELRISAARPGDVRTIVVLLLDTAQISLRGNAHEKAGALAVPANVVLILGEMMRMKISGLFYALVLLGTAHAADMPAEATSPTRQDMVKWKSDVLSNYDKVTYLDPNSRSISEETFINRVVTEKRGFNMSVASATPKHMTIRLLSDAEQHSAQTGMK